MTNLSNLPPAKQDWLVRELQRAQMIAATPPGVWPESLTKLAEKMLHQWSGWNVTSLPTALSETPRGSREAEPAGALSELPRILGELDEQRAQTRMHRAQFDVECM